MIVPCLKRFPETEHSESIGKNGSRPFGYWEGGSYRLREGKLFDTEQKTGRLDFPATVEGQTSGFDLIAYFIFLDFSEKRSQSHVQDFGGKCFVVIRILQRLGYEFALCIFHRHTYMNIYMP